MWNRGRTSDQRWRDSLKIAVKRLFCHSQNATEIQIFRNILLIFCLIFAEKLLLRTGWDPNPTYSDLESRRYILNYQQQFVCVRERERERERVRAWACVFLCGLNHAIFGLFLTMTTWRDAFMGLSNNSLHYSPWVGGQAEGVGGRYVTYITASGSLADPVCARIRHPCPTRLVPLTLNPKP